MKTAHVLKAASVIKRASGADMAPFDGIAVGNIVDALGRTGALDPAIKAITSANRFIGTALTVDAGPRDNLAPWAALKLARPGDVMMIATGAYRGSSVCGDVLIGMAANAGVGAIVTDGMIRDIGGSNAAGIPVFAAGVNPNSPQKNGPGSVGLPLVIGGIGVGPGDIVCGDEDGVVVIPAWRIVEAKQALVAVRAKEEKMEAAVRAGDTAPDWVSEATIDDLFTLVD